MYNKMIAKNMLRYSVTRYHSHQNLNMISRTFSAAPILNRKTSPSLPNLATAKEVTKKTEIKRKAFSRLFDFLEHYGEKVLDKLLPEVAMKVEGHLNPRTFQPQASTQDLSTPDFSTKNF